MKRLVLLIVAALVPWAFAADIYVTKAGNDTTGDGTVAKPYLTIQKGVDNASDGDTVHVGAGSYAETLTFDASESGESITIVGAAGTYLAPNLSGTAAVTFAIACNITFDHILLSATGTCWVTLINMADLDAHLTMTDCSVTATDTANLTHGCIYLAAKAGASREVHLTRCTIHNPRTAASGIVGVLEMTDVSALSVVDCALSEAAADSSIMRILATNTAPTTVTITGTTFTAGNNAVFVQGTSTGIVPDYTIGTFTCTGNTFAGTGTAASAVKFTDTATAVMGVGPITFADNTFSATGFAFYLRTAATKVTLRNNTLTKSTASDGDTHIITIGTEPGGGGSITDGVEIVGNRITYAGSNANLHGIFIGEGVDAGEVAYNTVNVAHELGIVIKGANNLNVHHNVVSSAAGSIYLKSDSAHIHVEHNTCYSVGASGKALMLEKADTGGANLHPTFAVITDNIFYASGSGAYCVYDNTDLDDTRYDHGRVRIDRNLYYAVSSAKLANWQGTDYAGSAAGLTALQAAWPSVAADADGGTAWADNDARSTFADPLLIAPTAADFRLQSNSPCLDVPRSGSTQLKTGARFFNALGAFQQRPRQIGGP